jgi:hypothetical protein
MELIEMAWDDDARGAFVATRTAKPELYASLHRRLTELASDPSRDEFRRRRMHQPPVWLIPVAAGNDDWVILWRAAEDGVPEIWYVGASPT